MLALSDDQLATVMTAAGGLPVEKRDLFLERVATRLHLRGRSAMPTSTIQESAA
jgi:hypothetical protein